jgi:uroporphyrinogen-III synthase
MSSLIYLLSPLKKEETTSLPMISFSLVTNKIDFLDVEILMFTSKQAVVSTDEIDKSWRNYPCIAIGNATKKKIESLGGTVVFAPKEFYAKSLNNEIKERFSDKKILYLRPKEVSFDSKSYLAECGIKLKEQILYETSCVDYDKSNTPKEGAIIIFTSPSTIRCFFKNFDWNDSYTAVLIGKATQKHLPTYCKSVISSEPLIDSCIKKAFSLLKKSNR